jgi:hypothetical protein
MSFSLATVGYSATPLSHSSRNLVLGHTYVRDRCIADPEIVLPCRDGFVETPVSAEETYVLLQLRVKLNGAYDHSFYAPTRLVRAVSNHRFCIASEREPVSKNQ